MELNMELNDEFFQMAYSLPQESEIIISDNEVFAELGLHEYMFVYDKSKMYIDIDYDQINALIKIYFKRIFNPDEHMMLFDHKILYSHDDCVEFIKVYQAYLQSYEFNYSLFVNDKFYKDIYLNCKRMSKNEILVRPKKFEVFKEFINRYYEYIIDQLKMTIKYLNYNITLCKEPLTLHYFSNLELLEMLTTTNEMLSTKTTFSLFREYGIPIKMKHKMNLITNTLLNKYITKDIKNVIIDMNVLLIEFYKYEYAFDFKLPIVTVNDMLTHDLFTFIE